MNGDWQHFVAAWLVQTIQTRTHGTDNYRADDLQVRRVKRQRQVNQTAFGFDIRREAHVVLHVTGAEMFFMFAGEFVEQLLGLFTQYVDQHVQTTTVRHTQHHFTGAALARMADHLFEHRHQRVAAFQREAFGSRELRAQVAFQTFRGGQLAQEALFLFRGKGGMPRFKTLLNPTFFFGAGNVHIFRADVAAVGLLERVNQIAELHRLFADSKRTYVKALLEVGLSQIVESGI